MENTWMFDFCTKKRRIFVHVKKVTSTRLQLRTHGCSVVARQHVWAADVIYSNTYINFHKSMSLRIYVQNWRCPMCNLHQVAHRTRNYSTARAVKRTCARHTAHIAIVNTKIFSFIFTTQRYCVITASSLPLNRRCVILCFFTHANDWEQCRIGRAIQKVRLSHRLGMNEINSVVAPDASISAA